LAASDSESYVLSFHVLAFALVLERIIANTFEFEFLIHQADTWITIWIFSHLVFKRNDSPLQLWFALGPSGLAARLPLERHRGWTLRLENTIPDCN